MLCHTHSDMIDLSNIFLKWYCSEYIFLLHDVNVSLHTTDSKISRRVIKSNCKTKSKHLHALFISNIEENLHTLHQPTFLSLCTSKVNTSSPNNGSGNAFATTAISMIDSWNRLLQSQIWEFLESILSCE
jgi:hypothetical protein